MKIINYIYYFNEEDSYVYNTKIILFALSFILKFIFKVIFIFYIIEILLTC